MSSATPAGLVIRAMQAAERQISSLYCPQRSHEKLRCSRPPCETRIAWAAMAFGAVMLAFMPGVAAAGRLHPSASPAASHLSDPQAIASGVVTPQGRAAAANSALAVGARVATGSDGGPRRSHARRLAAHGAERRLAQLSTVQTLILQVCAGRLASASTLIAWSACNRCNLSLCCALPTGYNFLTLCRRVCHGRNWATRCARCLAWSATIASTNPSTLHHARTKVRFRRSSAPPGLCQPESADSDLYDNLVKLAHDDAYPQA